MTPKELKNLSKEARKLINNYCEQTKTNYTPLAIAAKIHPAQLLKFMRNDQGLTINTLEKLGAYIDKNTNK